MEQNNKGFSGQVLLAIPSLLLSLLSPFIGYMYILSICGGHIYRNSRNSVLFYISLIIGVLVFWSVKQVTFLEVADITFGVTMVLIVFIGTLRQKKDYLKAFFYAALLQISYAFVRAYTLGSIYEERLETFFLGYRGIFESTLTGMINTPEQPIQILDTMMRFMIDYQIAIWGIIMLISMYLSMVFVAKKLDIQWKHHLLRFPYWLSYVLILTLVFAIFQNTRLIALNGLMMLMVFYLIQGLSVIDFIARNHFKRSRFIMIATSLLIIMNFFFAITIAIFGLLDYWLDIRKLNQQLDNE